MWEASSADDMLKRFAVNHIHVVGKANDNMAPGLDGWEEDKIADFFDVWERREVHGESYRFLMANANLLFRYESPIQSEESHGENG